VDGISHATLSYDAWANTDGDDPPDSDGTTIVVTQGQALWATGDWDFAAPVDMLTRDAAEAATTQAIVLWSPHLVMAPNIKLSVTDLPAGMLGWAHGNTITLDFNGNGAGWYTGQGALATGQYDLLTVVSHEIGHLLG
jgi:hypothetical protein